MSRPLWPNSPTSSATGQAGPTIKQPLLCLVTDRRRLTAACGQPPDAWRPLLLGQIRGAAAGGADLVQIRELDLEAAEISSLVRDALMAVRGSKTQIIVNDRLDIAFAAGADGVHLRATSIKTEAIRRISGSLLVGRSVHSVDAVNRAGAVDYLIAGTIFPTASKPASQSLGIEGLERVTRMAGSVPVLAIGGMTAERIGAVARAGATGLAAIGAFIPTDRGVQVETAVEKLTKILRIAFDTVGLVS